MKQTPFYEISIALQGRSKLFRVIVICTLHLSFLILLQFAGDVLKESAPDGQMIVTKQKTEKSFPLADMNSGKNKE